MDNKYGLKHPVPQQISLFITKAIAEETDKNVKENKPFTFSISACQIIEEAIKKACSEFDEHGIYAGISGEKKND